MARRYLSSLASATSGSMALEYGLLLPALLLIMMGTMDVGRLIWTYTTLNRAVEAASRCAAVNTSLCGTPGQIANRAASEAWGLGAAANVFTSQTQACGVKVTANYGFTLLIPWSGETPDHQSGAITLSVSACYPL